MSLLLAERFNFEEKHNFLVRSSLCSVFVPYQRAHVNDFFAALN